MPRIERVDLWLRARVQVPTRPDWFFVKLHAHGAPESGQRVLLGEPMVEFHRALARRAGCGSRLPLSLRDREGDVQSGPGRRGGLDGFGRRGSRLRAHLGGRLPDDLRSWAGRGDELSMKRTTR